MVLLNEAVLPVWQWTQCGRTWAGDCLLCSCVPGVVFSALGRGQLWGAPATTGWTSAAAPWGLLGGLHVRCALCLSPWHSLACALEGQDLPADFLSGQPFDKGMCGHKEPAAWGVTTA